MIPHILTALATAVIVGGPLLLVAAHYANERAAALEELESARRTLRQVLKNSKAHRDSATAPQVGQKNPSLILSPSDRESAGGTDRSAFAPAEPPSAAEEQMS